MLDKVKIEKFEALLDRKLESDEILRLQRVQSILKISSNDAIWDIIVAFEYQKEYYKKLPMQIEKIIKNSLNQSANFSKHNNINFIQFVIFSILILLISSGSMWVGYGLGIGKVLPASSVLFMPFGYILIFICISISFYLIYLVARKDSKLTKSLPECIAILCLLIISGMLLAFFL